MDKTMVLISDLKFGQNNSDSCLRSFRSQEAAAFHNRLNLEAG